MNLKSKSSILDNNISTSWITVSSFLNELWLSLLKKLFCLKLSKFLVFALDKLLVLLDLVIFLVDGDWFLLDKLLVLFTIVIFLFSELLWKSEVGWLAISGSEIDEIKCAFEEDLALKW